jgi:hypothetical protein
MKKITFKYFKLLSILFITVGLLTGCERDISDDAFLATFADTAEVFTDNPVGMGSDFYFPYGPDVNNPVGSKPTAWSVDNQVSYEGTSSMRIDVPDGDDPEGNFAGAILRIDGAGRNLTGFDALTFWAKSTQSVRVGEFGFGEDFIANKYVTTLTNTPITTAWTKIIIPIPDASKLLEERGMFRYSAGGTGANNLGYTLWIDELRFEKLGTIAQPRPVILNGQDLVQQSFTGSTININGLTQTYNTASGRNITVIAAPSYYNFISSDTSVATVNELGEVSIVGSGTATITASIGGVLASGSLQVTSAGALPSAPLPALPQANVSSIFSDAYPQVTSSVFSPGFGGSTTQASVVTSGNDSVLIYTNNNFTGILFDNTVNASTLNFMHVDVYTQESGVQIEFQIRDIGTNGEINTNIFTGQPEGDDADKRFVASGLTVNGWTSFDIPLNGSLTNQRGNLGAIILAGGPNFILDNIYFYRP